MIYTVTINPALDYTLKVKSLDGSDINRSFDEAIYYGGKGINVSVVLSRLGVRNKALGFLAGFTGDELERMLKADGIDCDFIRLESGMTRINVKLISQKALDINANGPEIKSDDIYKLIKKLKDNLKQDDYLILAGSAPTELGEKTYERILECLDGKGIKSVVDASGGLLKSTLKHKPFLIKPNRFELEEFFGVKIQNSDDAFYYAKKLQSQGAENVLISLGEDGALLLDSNGEKHKIKNAQGKAVNCVGCGDSMVAGFIAGYIKTNDYSYALRLATACGNATAYSPSLAEKENIFRLFDELEKNYKE
ncbi:MAG: 1-phosphofructokinase [Eubacterium sp.]|nr:1-phosphofructokinase [Eubacterium sp.]